MHAQVARRTGPRPAGAVALAVVLMLVLSVLSGCSGSAERRAVEGEVESHTEGTFYDPPAPLPAGQPGEIIRSETC